MKQAFLVVVGAIGLSAAFADGGNPVRVTSLTQRNSRVTVTYELDAAPAVVTADVSTNRGDGVYVSIGARNFRGLSGDVNRLVTGAGRHALTWKPRKDWPEGQAGTVRVTLTAWATNCPPDYMVVDLSERNGAIRYYAEAEAIPEAVGSEVSKTSLLVLRKCPAAGVVWRMGDGARDDQAATYPPHLVTLTEDYYIGVYELTRGQHARMGGDSTFLSQPDYPLANVTYGAMRGGSWPEGGHARIDYGSRHLYNYRTYTGIGLLDMPTEAQWEFACRAGTQSQLYSGKAFSNEEMDRLAWWRNNSGDAAHPVGLKEPNAWGLYDMYGNLQEFVLDGSEAFAENLDTPAVDPVGPVNGTRVRRGGGYEGNVPAHSSSTRAGVNQGNGYSFIGFRLACPAAAVR